MDRKAKLAFHGVFHLRCKARLTYLQAKMGKQNVGLRAKTCAAQPTTVLEAINAQVEAFRMLRWLRLMRAASA
jgi:hypothetical protein